jgi:hypothetical protein
VPQGNLLATFLPVTGGVGGGQISGPPFGSDRWAWFIGKKFAFFRRKTPLLRLERRLSSRAQSPLFRGSCDELYVTAMFYFAS